MPNQVDDPIHTRFGPFKPTSSIPMATEAAKATVQELAQHLGTTKIETDPTFPFAVVVSHADHCKGEAVAFLAA